MEITKIFIWGLEVDDEAFFSTIVTISVFILGYLVNAWYDNKKENNRLKDIQSLIFSLIDDFKTQIPQQSNELRAFANQILKDEDSSLMTNHSIETQLVLEYKEDIYKIIFKLKAAEIPLKREIFKSIRHNVNQIHVLLAQFDSIVSDFKFVNSKYEEEMDIAGTQFYQLLNMIKFDQAKSKIEKEILDIYQNYKRSTRENLMDTLINPIEDLCTKEKSKHSHDFLIKTSEINTSYKYLVTWREYYSKKLIEYANSLDKLNDDLQNSVNKFNMMGDRSSYSPF